MNKSIDQNEIKSFVGEKFPDVVSRAAWGETSFFYNPAGLLRRGTYIATIKEKDGANDRASRLNRPGVWRLNIGVSVATFEELFGERPGRPAKGDIVSGEWMFDALDRLNPHPVYGWMGWIAICNPTLETFERIKPLLKDAHHRARLTFIKRTRRSEISS